MAQNNKSLKASDIPCPQIEIFISHRSEDAEIARMLQFKLHEELAKDKVVVHVCEDTQGQKSWRKWIEKTIHSSQIMIFLYTVEHEEAWRWCMYEIGMFNGLRISDESRSLIFLKNPHIKELPDPLSDITFYEANTTGIDEFLKNLLFKGEHTPGRCRIVSKEEKDSAYNKAFKESLEEINIAFRRSRLHIEYYTYRITMELNLAKHDNERLRIEESTISGDKNTMDTLNLPPNILTWEALKRNFEDRGPQKWIKELELIPENVAKNKVVEKVLNPIKIDKGEKEYTFLPVVSSIEKMYPHQKDGPHEPTKINVIFIPQRISQEGILERLPTFLPFSKVKIKLIPSDDGFFYSISDDDDAVQVVEMNNLCLKIYNLSPNQFARGKREWTGLDLIERLRKLGYVSEENIEKLNIDQARVIEELLLKGFHKSEALIPLHFNDNHPSYPDQCFLPVIVSSQIEETTEDQHDANLLVAYVKDFWPADHNENPYNIDLEKSKSRDS